MAVVTAVFALLTAALLLLSKYYNAAYGMPKSADGVLSYVGYGTDAKISNNLNGEWNFYYGKWIVTDGYDGQPDGVINIPTHWTGMTTPHGKLPKTGYASYSMTVRGLPEGTRVSLALNNQPVPFRAFVNGQKVAQNGEVGKTADTSFTNGKNTLREYYTVGQDETLEIVIETAYNNHGGIFNAPWLMIDRGAPSDAMYFINYSAFVVFGIMISSIILSIVLSAGIYRSNGDFTLVLLFAAILVHYVYSKEMFGVVPYKYATCSYDFVMAASFISGALMMATLVIHMIRVKLIEIKTSALIIYGAANALYVGAYYALWGTNYRFIPIIFILVSFGYLLYFVVKSAAEKKPFAKCYTAIACFLLAQCFAEQFDSLGIIVFGVDAYFSVIIMSVTVVLNSVYLLKAKHTADEAKKSALLDVELKDIKQKALKSQIKPHFVFNSLTSIQSQYHKNLNAGDEALNKFSRHLRLNVDAYNRDTVSFGEELKNILNYFELENMRTEDKLTLLLDTDENTDFQVPILSLQPLIENAIKYAGTEEKEDGYILIESRTSEADITVRIIDNGRGFDVNKIETNSTGISNVTERIRYLVNGTLTVKSEIGKGTTVTITIPKAAEEK